MSECGSRSAADFRKRFTRSFFWKQAGDCCPSGYVAKWCAAPRQMLFALLEGMENSGAICSGWIECSYREQVMSFCEISCLFLQVLASRATGLERNLAAIEVSRFYA